MRRDESGYYTQSSAALQVARTLKSPVLNAAAVVFEPVPRGLRDVAYRLVADNRYKILGKDADGGEASCKLRADASLHDRFLM